ncbi:APC family permease [Diaminobutyricibacter tongyongensis]|uniref:APC family permease n=1 Tax=Leifsonia tongyongensis TaxID=1268043 RepID=A0A6L9XV75_9MICO|nr:APC family permease [Diaminobutyricibacter tongyongensis]NEN05330.1 APC family permease [Diaminobutyricibacter tongyongensis]
MTTSQEKPASAPTSRRLQGGVLTIPNAIALSAAAMAPVLAVVLNAPAAASAAGGALPLSFLIAFIAAALVGNTVVQFSRRLPSAGSFYTFNSQGLGPAAGFFTGWLFWIGYAVLAPGLFTAFGAFVQDYVSSTFGVQIQWWIFSLAAMAIILGLSLRSIKASVNLDLALLSIEVVIFLILGVVAVSTAGTGNTGSVFLPSFAPTGFTGVGLGVVFGLLSFIGFDAAATLGEETRNPKRNIPLAIIGALGAVGTFYVFMMYALTAGYRVNDSAHMAAFLKDTSPFVTLAQHVAPWIVQPIEIAAIFGIFSCFLAIHNTTVRVMFSMGRDKVLPSSLGGVHPRWFSPDRAIYAQTAFTVIIGLAVGVWLGPGATGAYGFTGAIGTVAIVIVYILSNIALIRYFWRRADRKVFTHVIVPILGVIALAYPLYSVSTPGQAWPYNLVPFVVLIWVVAGVILFLRYRAKSPEKIAALGSFIAEDDLPLDEQPESLLAARAPSLQHPTVKEEVENTPEVEERR